jgi:hypothetical protein
MKLKVLRNHETVLEPYNSIGILSEAMSFSRLHSLAEMTHSNIRPLGGNDVFFDAVHSRAKWPEQPQLKQVRPKVAPAVDGAGMRITGGGGGRALGAAR